MRTRMTLVALMTVGLIGLAPSAPARRGRWAGRPRGYTALPVLRGRAGENPPHVLSIDDQFTDATEEKVGKLKLVCTPTDWSVVNSDVARGQPVGQEQGDHLTCYEVDDARAIEVRRNSHRRVRGADGESQGVVPASCASSP